MPLRYLLSLLFFFIIHWVGSVEYAQAETRQVSAINVLLSHNPEQVEAAVVSGVPFSDQSDTEALILETNARHMVPFIQNLTNNGCFSRLPAIPACTLKEPPKF